MILYIDPGTGSMIFAALLGIVSTVVFSLKGLLVKLKYRSDKSVDMASSENKENIVLFSEGRQYIKCFKPIVSELEARGVRAMYLTMDSNDSILDMDLKHVECKCIGNNFKAFTVLNNLNAKKVLSTTPGLDVYQWKKTSNVDEYVHFFHALGAGTEYRCFGLDFYDTCLTTASVMDDYIREIETIRNIPQKKLIPVGCTYMDVLNEQIKSKSVEPVFEDNQKTTIIWAPSWGASSTIRMYKEILGSLLNSSYNVIVRPHPESFKVEKEVIDSLLEEFGDYKNFYLDRNPDNYNSLANSELLISDFSGIMLDFLFCFDKPVIMVDTGYNFDFYDCYWSEKGNWVVQTVAELGEKIVPEELKNIEEICTNLINNEEKNNLRRKCKNLYWDCIGESSSKIVDYLTDKAKE